MINGVFFIISSWIIKYCITDVYLNIQSFWAVKYIININFECSQVLLSKFYLQWLALSFHWGYWFKSHDHFNIFFFNKNSGYIYFTLVTLTCTPQCKKNIVVNMFNFVNIRGQKIRDDRKKETPKPKWIHWNFLH